MGFEQLLDLFNRLIGSVEVNRTIIRERESGTIIADLTGLEDEVIVAAGLLSSVLLFSMALIPSFKMSNRRANMELQASAIAQSTLEAYRGAEYDTLSTNTDTVQKDDIVFNRETVVTDFPSGLAKEVRVELTWRWKEKNFRVFRQTVISRVPRS